jgi:hypothetical protein
LILLEFHGLNVQNQGVGEVYAFSVSLVENPSLLPSAYNVLWRLVSCYLTSISVPSLHVFHLPVSPVRMLIINLRPTLNQDDFIWTSLIYSQFKDNFFLNKVTSAHSTG